MAYNYGSMNLLQLIIVMVFSSVIISIVGKSNNYSIKRLLSRRKLSNLLQLFLFIFVIGLLVFLSAYREIGISNTYIGGYDAYAYKNFFLGLLTSTHFEPGFVLLIRVIRSFTDKYSGFLIIVSLYMLWCMIKFLKDIKNSNVFLIFMLLILYFSSFNTLRTSLAIFTFLLIIQKINSKKYFMSIILAIFATSLHVSSLIIFPVIIMNYIFGAKKKLSTTKIILLVVAMSFVLLLLTFFATKYLSSTSYESYVGNGQIVTNVYLFAALIFYLSNKKYDSLINHNEINRVFVTTIPLIFLVFPMQIIMVIMYRMVEFFLPIIYSAMAEIWIVDKKLATRLLLLALFLYKIVGFFTNINYIGIGLS